MTTQLIFFNFFFARKHTFIAYTFSAAQRNPKKACLTVTDEDNAELSKCDAFNPVQQFQAVRIYTEDTTNPVLLLMSVSTKFRLLIPLAVL